MEKINQFLNTKLRVISLGIENFAEDLRMQEVETIHVDWKPLPARDPELLAIVNQIRKK